jgi:hypothetical protein
MRSAVRRLRNRVATPEDRTSPSPSLATTHSGHTSLAARQASTSRNHNSSDGAVPKLEPCARQSNLRRMTAAFFGPRSDATIVEGQGVSCCFHARRPSRSGSGGTGGLVLTRGERHLYPRVALDSLSNACRRVVVSVVDRRLVPLARVSRRQLPVLAGLHATSRGRSGRGLPRWSRTAGGSSTVSRSRAVPSWPCSAPLRASSR